MAAVLDVAQAHHKQQAAIARKAAGAAEAWWRTLDPSDLTGSWLTKVGVGVSDAVVAGQLLAAGQADTYLTTVLGVQGTDAPADAAVAPTGFAGRASDGRDLPGLLYQPVITTKIGLAGGLALDEALLVGLSRLVLIVGTQVQDAGRLADQAAIVSRPKVTGYTRLLSLPSCSRCVILAGRWYRWSSGFERHLKCDCRHVPARENRASDFRTDPMTAVRSGRVTGLSQAETKALDGGADLNQLVNAHRGMSVAGARHDPGRPSVDQAMRTAGDSRPAAIAVLQRFGYLAA